MSNNDSTSLLFEAAPMGTSDSIPAMRPSGSSLGGAGVSAAPPPSVAGSIQPQSPPQQPGQPQPSILQQSSHPGALVFHVAFKIAALLVYMFGWLFRWSFIFSFVIIILLLSFDFWTVKNVTGRLLVGLRWWNEIKEDGSNVWIFESRENRNVNPTDSRVFWVALYAAPAIWGVFGLLALLQFSFSWLLVVIVAIVLNMANVIGYTKCEKDARQKVTSYISQNSYVQGFVGSFISDRINGMFGGGSTANANAPRRRNETPLLINRELWKSRDQYWVLYQFIRILQFFAFTMYFLEIALKWVDSFEDFWASGWNVADFAIILLVWLGAFIFRNIVVGVMVNNFDKISENLKEEKAENEKMKRFEKMRRKLNKELAVQGNLRKSSKTNLRGDESKPVTSNSTLNQAGLDNEPYGNHPHEYAKRWEATVAETLTALASTRSETMWPRDTLFKYLQLMENLQENMKEYEELQLLATSALLEIHDT
ncbi:Golgi apparatus membrane protein TVP23 A [Phlyctochytrium bullatum]|nr:Golgi apparatus membrane protein TVP23 A [Phlyctochytrium bullatum]